ncbi:hypothetical protein C2845_PM14G06170 [Panicum miliaceum]|uniref:Uncharacterized protein n=1 Tax=Panicum miliaceum TaxID=4540 RepID=A0A3L6PPY5_PANMI|nr:hypothetical protein C2845_PM14G06170 [Panicum miliaceum]
MPLIQAPCHIRHCALARAPDGPGEAENMVAVHDTAIKIRTLTDKEQLVLSLERQYEDDIGVIAALFFNYVKLSPGEALYIGANEPHAYLSGECIECMATSDNVVRAGLTPKYKDIQTPCSMLTYKQAFPEILQGVRVQPYVRRYTPPFDEFEVDCCLVPRCQAHLSLSL